MSHHNNQAAKCDWRTRKWLLDRVRKVFGGRIGLDPATAYDNPTDAKVYYTEGGLERDWYADMRKAKVTTMFVNPPWSKTTMPVTWWMAPIWAFAIDHPELDIITTAPASVNSGWWHDYVAPAPRNMLPRGRIEYDAPPGYYDADAPSFDTCITYWGQNPWAFDAAFGDLGKMIQ